MLSLILTEAALFAYLFFSYFYLAAHAASAWPPGGPPALNIAIPGTIILMAGSVVMWWGERGMDRGKPRQLAAGIASALVLGVVFVAMQAYEWSRQPFHLSTDVYSSLYFTVTGFHILHVIVGLLMLAVLLVWTWRGYMSANRHAAASIAAVYWHFVTIVWIAVFFTIYIAPRLSLSHG
jgi:heme/copper-type cytochrome/quinol oxidase subunit 3